MPSYNKIIIMGNITRDPELKYTQGGQVIAKFGIAVNENYRKADGSDAEDVLFIDCECWGKSAETIRQYMRKGSPIMVDGKLKLETWEKDGQKRSKHVVSIKRFQFIGGKGSRDDAPSDEDGIPF